MEEFFELSYKRDIQGNLVQIYTSLRTGAIILNAQIESPLVQGYFTLLTEESCDDGLPHTLEHLVFLGSKKYPYKGVLDTLANRCLANGTNAWTAIDHTAYTITTAGEEGFLEIFPVYLDHILRPTLSDDAFLTEIAYIDKNGEWKGVVYSEMQSYENKRECLISRSVLKNVYPNSGYCWETGGILKNLRHLTNEKVRQYHAKYYRLDNLAIIINGKIDIQRVLEIVKAHEDEHIKDDNIASLSSPHPLPWSAPLSPIQPEVKEIIYPSDEKQGALCIGWRGPCLSDIRTGVALEVLSNYLADSNESPLQQQLVEVTPPLCSDVTIHIQEYKEYFLSLEAEDTNLEDLDTLHEKIFSILDSVLSSPLDMERLHRIALRESRRFKEAIEMDGLNSFGEIFIQCFLRHAVSRDRSAVKKGSPLINRDFSSWKLDEHFGTPAIYESLLAEEESFWKGLLTRYLDKKHCCVVKGKPCAKRMDELHQENVRIIEDNKEKYGEEKLCQFESNIQRIKEAQLVKPPAAVVESFPLADIENVTSVKISTYTNFPAENVANESNIANTALSRFLKKAPVPIIANVYPSEFVNSIMFVRLPESVNTDLLYLYSSMILESPLGEGAVEEIRLKLPEKDTSLYPFLWEGTEEERKKNLSHIGVSSRVNHYMTDCTTDIGMNGDDFIVGEFPSCLVIEFSSTKENYWRALETVLSTIYGIEFTRDRVLKIAEASLLNLKQKKQSGSQVRAQIDGFLRRSFEHPRNKCGIAQQEGIYNRIVEDVVSAVRELNGIQGRMRDTIHRGEYALSMAGNLLLESLPLESILKSICCLTDVKGRSHTKTLPEFLSLNKELTWRHAVDITNQDIGHSYSILIGGSAAVQSGYLSLTTNGLGYPKGRWGDENEPILAIICEFISVMEGILFKAVRGSGYSYGCDYFFRRQTGEVTLSIAPAVELVKGFLAGLNVFEALYEMSKNGTIPAAEFDAAKSSTLYSIVRLEENVSTTSEKIVLNLLRGLPVNYNQQIIKRTNSVTKSQFEKVLLELSKEWKKFGKEEDKGVKEIKKPTLSVVVSMNDLEKIVEEIRCIFPKWKVAYGSTKSLLRWIGTKDENGVVEHSPFVSEILYGDEEESECDGMDMEDEE